MTYFMDCTHQTKPLYFYRGFVYPDSLSKASLSSFQFILMVNTFEYKGGVGTEFGI